MKPKEITSDNTDSVIGNEIPFQPASVDIWDKKYRLKKKDGTAIDNTVNDTFVRVARTLADQEQSGNCNTSWQRTSD